MLFFYRYLFIIYLFIYLVIKQTLLSKATYKWGQYRSNQNQQKSNNMHVLLQVLLAEHSTRRKKQHIYSI